MNEYLKKYHRQPGWDFLTGTRSDIETLVRAFDGYKSVSNHNPLMLILNPMNGKWLRLSGIVNSPELMQECSKLIRR
jgi:protein SCO1/2